MRDVVEIGIGREAVRTYELEDISLVPSRPLCSHREVSLDWKMDAYQFDLPFVADGSDALASPDFVIEMGKNGGLGVFNAEGLWSRWENAEEKIAEVRKAALESGDVVTPVTLLQELSREPIKKELLTAAVKKIHDSGVVTAVRVSPQHARELGPLLVEAGIDILFVQGTMVSAQYVWEGEELPLDIKELVRGTDIPVVVGGCVNYHTAMHLMRTGAAGIVVGYGATEGITTTGEVLGINVAMATAIADAAVARRDYMEESGGRYVHVIANGDLNSSGDIAKAIACGADAVMAGPLLAQAQEAAGKGVYWPIVAGHPANPRGAVVPVMTEYEADDEDYDGPTLEVILHGPSSEPFGTCDLAGGLRRSMAKCGYTSLKAFQRVELTVH